jgi:hypothetical protein
LILLGIFGGYKLLLFNGLSNISALFITISVIGVFSIFSIYAAKYYLLKTIRKARKISLIDRIEERTPSLDSLIASILEGYLNEEQQLKRNKSSKRS